VVVAQHATSCAFRAVATIDGRESERGMFKRKDRMGEYAPLIDPSYDEITERLARNQFDVPVNERNDYANALLAWAERMGPEEFAKWRSLVVQSEIGICARDWTARSEDDTETAVARITMVVDHFVREVNRGRRVKNYEDGLWANIPSVINAMYRSLVDSKDPNE
jgi:hypothetical protein